MSEKRAYQQRREHMLEAVKKRRAKVGETAVEYKGDSCKICGYNLCIETLEFHHIDPANKDFGISAKGYFRSWEKVKAEIEKCVLLCANCHRGVHAGKLQLSQVTVIEKSDEFREALTK